MNKVLIYLLPILFLFQSCGEIKKNKLEVIEVKNRKIYVNVNAKGLNNGQSWSDAFTSLIDAIEFSDEEDEIWVARGTYYPYDSLNRNSSFKLKDNTKLYGGFRGWELELSDRDFDENQTILSGDIGVKGDYRDNVYHVVIGGDKSLIDGVIVEAGNAVPDDNENNFVKDKLSYHGGGILNNNTSMEIKNVIIRNNRAFYGAGAYNSNHFNKSPITYNNATFLNNFAHLKGGAIENSFSSGVIVLNSKFINNKSEEMGGAIYNGAYSFQIMENILFEKNSSNFGGALVLAEYSASILNSVSFDSNEAELAGSAIYQEKSDNNYVELNGYKLKNNKSKISNIDFFSWDENNLYDDYILKALNKKLASSGYIENSEMLYSNYNLASYNRQLERLKNNFNQRNMRNNKKTKSETVRGKGKSKIKQKRVYVVDDNLEGNFDGKTWKTAFRDLQKALDYAYISGVNEVWIKEGVYRPHENDRGISFIVHDGLKVYGGFTGREKNLAQRSYHWHKTAISGNIGERILMNDNSYHTIKTYGNVLLDGLVIGWGTANSSEDNKNGGAVLAYTDYGDNLIIKNSIFRYGKAKYGGAVYAYGKGNVKLKNILFKLNKAENGGAVASRVEGSTELIDCIFERNEASVNGGGFYSDNANKLEFFNVDFRYNESGKYGGAIFLADFVKHRNNKTYEMDESVITDNEAEIGAGVVVVSGTSLNIEDTYFFNNYSADYKGYLRNFENSTITKNNITAENNY